MSFKLRIFKCVAWFFCQTGYWDWSVPNEIYQQISSVNINQCLKKGIGASNWEYLSVCLDFSVRKDIEIGLYQMKYINIILSVCINQCLKRGIWVWNWEYLSVCLIDTHTWYFDDNTEWNFLIKTIT